MTKASKKNLAREIAQELDVFDDMLAALVELLEEKGVLTQKEWEDKIESKVGRRAKSTSYREIQFGGS